MKKVIFLVDMNAFFISCEATRNQELKGKPAAVAGDPKNRCGIILAANYEARKYGIKTTMLVHEAKKLYKDLILVPPDHEFYDMKSREVMNILSKFTPVIQQNSIDEAWLDLTGCESLFGSPLEIAKKIMNSIIEELDLWCSIGISENKFLAKMASEMKKPLGITQIWKEDVKDKIWPLKVREMYGVGKQTEKKLYQLAIYTIGDIARFDKNLMFKMLGKYGVDLHKLANGIDESPVTESPVHDSKSISRSTTLPVDIHDIEYAKTILLELSEQVGLETRKSGLKGRTISIIIKYDDFESITRQKAVSPTHLTKEIYQVGVLLLVNNWNINRGIRLLGIALCNLVDNSAVQLSLFDITNDNKHWAREELLEKTMDAIKQKYGVDKIKRAKSIINLDKS